MKSGIGRSFRLLAALLMASTINGGLVHAAMGSMLSGSSPTAVHEPVKRDHVKGACVAGSKRLPCPLCSQSCSAGVGIVSDATPLVESPSSATGPMVLGGLPAARPYRNQPIRAPPHPSA